MARRFWRRGSSVDDGQEQEQAAAEQMPTVAEIMGQDVDLGAHDAPGIAEVEASPTPLIIRWPLLLIIGALVAAVIVVTGGMNARISPDLLARWPWLLMIGGGLWFLVGLVTGWSSGMLGGPVVAVAGLMIWWGQQGQVTASAMSVGGAMLVAGGAAFILRGLTMPRT